MMVICTKQVFSLLLTLVITDIFFFSLLEIWILVKDAYLEQHGHLPPRHQ